MKQDRKFNRMIMFASVLGVLAGIILLVSGAGAAVFGFLKHEELAKIKEVAFLINQEGLNLVQKSLLGGLLKTEYLFLVLGGVVAGIGLLVLIFSAVGIGYAKKHKVVRRRFAILFFNLIPVAIAGAIATYLVFEFKEIPDIVKYVCYGVGGVFVVIALFNLFGVLCSRSEKFMSNDNGKLSFDKSSLRDARAEVNNNVKDAEYQPQEQFNGEVYQEQQGTQVYQPMQQSYPNAQQYPQQARPMPPRPQGVPGQARPQGAMPPRPQGVPGQPRPQGPMAPRPQGVPGQARPQGIPGQPRPQGAMPARPANGIRPQMAPNGQPTARPVAPRPQGTPTQQRANTQHMYCLSCGSMLNPGEMFCKVCGAKVNK